MLLDRKNHSYGHATPLRGTYLTVTFSSPTPGQTPFTLVAAVILDEVMMSHAVTMRLGFEPVMTRIRRRNVLKIVIKQRGRDGFCYVVDLIETLQTLATDL